MLPHPQRSEAWFAARRGKITASMAAALLSVDPYTTPAQALAEIAGTAERKQNFAMAHGRRHEDDARRAYEAMTGNLVVESGFWVHDTLPWLGASPDGLIESRGRAPGLVELKCPAELPECVPAHHAIQIAVQLACTNRDWCHYFAWRPDGGRLILVERDRDFERPLLENLECIWRQHLAKGVAATTEATAMTPEAIEQAAARGESIPAAAALQALRVYGHRICALLDDRAKNIKDLRPEDLHGIAGVLRERISKRFPEAAPAVEDGI